VHQFRLRGRTLYGRWSCRPRRVTVFARRVEQTGAAQPQKQRRASTPALVVRFVRSFTFASPSLARSRRLQRASVPVPHVSLGQTSRPRPGDRKGMTLLLLPAARPRKLVAARTEILASARGVSRRLRSRAKRNVTVRAANVAPRRCCIACRFAWCSLTFPPVPVARARVACGCA